MEGVVNVSDIIGKEVAEGSALSTKKLSQEHLDMVNKVAKQVRIKFEDVLNDYLRGKLEKKVKMPGSSSGDCGCG